MAASDEPDFREGVEPLPEPRRVVPGRPRPAPVPRETWRDERAALAESLGPISPDDAGNRAKSSLTCAAATHPACYAS